MPIYAVILESWPEAAIFVSLGLTLVGYKIRKILGRILVVGAIHAIISYFVRALPIVYGVHTLILLVVMMLLVKIIIRTRWKAAVMGSIIGLTILLLAESTIIPLVSFATGISLKTAIEDPWLRVFFPYPHLAILLLATYLFNRYDIKLINLNDVE